MVRDKRCRVVGRFAFVGSLFQVATGGSVPLCACVCMCVLFLCRAYSNRMFARFQRSRQACTHISASLSDFSSFSTLNILGFSDAEYFAFSHAGETRTRRP